jgi:hypothetical protein
MNKPLKASGYSSTQNFRDFFNFLALFALVDLFYSAFGGFGQRNAAVAPQAWTAFIILYCSAG